MNVTEYTYLINRPDAVNDRQIIALEKILHDFPYFQSARSLHLKGIYKQDSFKYNTSLKKTAAFTTDRSILFDLITSENFIGIQKGFFEEKEAEIHNITVVDSTIIEIVTAEPEIKVLIPEINPLEKSIISSIKEANQDLEEEITIEEAQVSTIEEKLEIGKPLSFNTAETHSFQEWLQLAKVKPIVREENLAENNSEENNLSSKLDIIDKFIEANPKISPVKKDMLTPIFTIKEEDNSYLMTETLAKVYLEQKKYNKAIQAYEILILKYPEKITFFADRISDIKTLQQNNNS
ncbi:tetratricopeptide repeat protein [Flavobacterium sp.]|uniref:tetratricopeptide repeat protein n=1 Tax=Flavobacterium sp. TaxID=239 RepID=UPI00374DA77F